MSFFSKLFAFKFLWLEDIFNSMAKVWHDLTVTEQAISLQASGIIAIINANIGVTPDVLFSLIQAKFPEFTKEQLTSYLGEAAKVLALADSAAGYTFEQAIAAFQKYLTANEGNGWVATTVSAVNALLSILLPTTTPIQKITIALEYIYQHFVKGKIA